MSDELDKWKRQRLEIESREQAQRLQRQDTTHRARSAQRLPPPPDLTFSRIPLQNAGYGTQNTVVISDGRPADDVSRHQQQQEEMRLREEENARRQVEKRRQDQEGIARRQREAEEAARIARLTISDPSSSLVTSPAYHAPPGYREYPNLQSSRGPPVNPNPLGRQPSYYDARIGPASLPLENPSRYEGDSTDSESIHTRRLMHHRPPESRSPMKHLRTYVFSPSFITINPCSRSK